MVDYPNFYFNSRRKLKVKSKMQNVLIMGLGISLFVLPFAVTMGFMYKSNTLQNILPSLLNCKYYQEYDLTDEISASGYLQCTLDKKIKPLNKNFDFEEQYDYWNNISSIIEHSFEDKVKYQNQQPNLIGKYNTLDKIYMAFYKEYTLYQLGKIAIGEIEYVGPDYMFNENTWSSYYNVVKSEHKDYRKLSSLEQLKLAQRLQKLSDYVSDKFFSDYYKNVFIHNLMGIKYNTTNPFAKKILKNTLEKICEQDEEKYIDALTVKEVETESHMQIQEILPYRY